MVSGRRKASASEQGGGASGLTVPKMAAQAGDVPRRRRRARVKKAGDVRVKSDTRITEEKVMAGGEWERDGDVEFVLPCFALILQPS